ncbi:hypothetical protein XA68_11126 [Ophiocordyceps unilateralis]|uniref:Uncharacterized protein n=1 Tax=Ophiocordyceps unilateralis TaxID=268505 RepID=A0A2A9P217_OPHUN|nr:hypothetical protein XA68_11126 [Ophiocordyceps unilateralis]
MASVAASLDEAGIADVKACAAWMVSIEDRDNWAPYTNDQYFRDDHIQQCRHADRRARVTPLQLRLSFIIEDLRERIALIFKISGPCETVLRPISGTTFPGILIPLMGKDTALLDQTPINEGTLLRVDKETRSHRTDLMSVQI